MTPTEDVFAQFLESQTFSPSEIRSGAMADYVALKNLNDSIRETHLSELFRLLLGAAAHASDKGVTIVVEQAFDHRFKLGAMTLGGQIVKFRHGLRCFTAEAGWTRLPSDGFMRGNALAAARLSHFGMAKATEELHLLKFEERPRWFRVGNGDQRVSFETADVVRHFRLLLGI